MEKIIDEKQGTLMAPSFKRAKWQKKLYMELWLH
jgi:hypothetical protein